MAKYRSKIEKSSHTELCKCSIYFGERMSPDITFAQTHNQLPCMLGNMACHHNHVADNRTESATMYLMACFSSANGFLSNHPQDIVGKNGQFKHQFIGVKLSGRQPFHIHIGLDFTVKLLTFTMGMVILNDFFIYHPGIRPPSVHFQIRRKKLTIFIDGAFYDFVSCTYGNGFITAITV